MLLQGLYQYGLSNNTPIPIYEEGRIDYILHIRSNGTFGGVQKVPDDLKFSVPKRFKRNRAFPLLDNGYYLLGSNEEKQDDFFVASLDALEQYGDVESHRALLKFYEHYKKDKKKFSKELLQCLRALTPKFPTIKGKLLSIWFALAFDNVPDSHWKAMVLNPPYREFYEQQNRIKIHALEPKIAQPCLITGQVGNICRLHTKYAMPGTKGETPLVTFNAPTAKKWVKKVVDGKIQHGVQEQYGVSRGAIDYYMGAFQHLHENNSVAFSSSRSGDTTLFLWGVDGQNKDLESVRNIVGWVGRSKRDQDPCSFDLNDLEKIPDGASIHLLLLKQSKATFTILSYEVIMAAQLKRGLRAFQSAFPKMTVQKVLSQTDTFQGLKVIKETLSVVDKTFCCRAILADDRRATFQMGVKVRDSIKIKEFLHQRQQETRFKLANFLTT